MKKRIRLTEGYLRSLVESIINETYHFHDENPYTSSEYEDIDGNIYDVTDVNPKRRDWGSKYKDEFGEEWDDNRWADSAFGDDDRIRQVQKKHAPMVSDNPDAWLKRKQEAQKFYDDYGMSHENFYDAFDKMKERYPDTIKAESRRRMVNAITESVIRRLRRR